MIEELRQLIAMASQYEHLTPKSLFATLAVALVCGGAIYLVYRFFFRGVVYSDNFGVLIIMVSAVTAFIIITIGANLVLSLGMVGALSIVRFRAAVKDPLDVGFLFWAVAAGLTAGARLYLVAFIGTAVIALAYIVLCALRRDKRSFLLILRYAPEDEAAVKALFENQRYKLKNRTSTAEQVEMTAEVKVRGNDTDFLAPFNQSKAIESAVLVEYSGDYS